ncbi:MAG: DNA polymerase IV [Acidobacteriota bacterium]
MTRTIFHIDMDAFYASVEQRDQPEHKGKPVIVGADPRDGQGRGVVAACSYEARKFGIHSAMPISKAFRLCPRGIYLRPDFERYQDVSRKIRSIFRDFTDRVEPLSIDEAFLDMSEKVVDDQSALEAARLLKRTILDRERLTSSIGIAPNKFIAKIASDLKKPDGLLLVRVQQIQAFLDPLPISRLWGVGPVTERKLSEIGIKSIRQLRESDRLSLVKRFGKLGEHLWELSHGEDHRPVLEDREPKSIGHETTFPEDVLEQEVLQNTLRQLSQSVARRLERRKFTARTITLKLRYSDFTTITRQITLAEPLQTDTEIYSIARTLLRRFCAPDLRVRLIGVSTSSFITPAGEPHCRQMNLFE